MKRSSPAPPPAVLPAVPPENTPLDPAGDDMDDDLLDEINPPAFKRKGEFGAIQVPPVFSFFFRFQASKIWKCCGR